MRKNAFQLMQKIGYFTGLVPDYNFTSFSDATLRTQLLNYLNNAKQWICREVDLDTLIDTTTIGTVASYQTGKVGVTQGHTTVTGVATAFTSAMLNRKIRLQGSNTPYNIIKITNGTSLEIDIPYVEPTVTGGTFVIFQDAYPMPAFVSRVLDVRRLDYKQVLEKKPISWIMSRYPDPLLDTSNPLFYCTDGDIETRDPLGASNYTAQAGTSTSAVVNNALTNLVAQNYYKGWQLYNVTRLSNAEVTGYDISTNTLTIDSPITGQTTGDTFYLDKREQALIVRPTPILTMPLSLTFVHNGSLFYNDTDLENEIDDDYQDVLVYKAAADFYIGRDAAKQAQFQAEAERIINFLNKFNEEMPLSNSQFTGGCDMPNIDVWGGETSAQAGTYTVRN